MKFGKKPAVHTPRRQRAMLVLGAHLDALGPPPAATYNRVAVRAKLGLQWYQMDGNDEYGDCVWVDSGNTVPLLQANAGSPIVVPTLAQVLKCYSDTTGFIPAQGGQPSQNDNGTDENTAEAYLKTTGIAGCKIDDYAPVDPTNMDHIKWAIALFGKVRTGICVDDRYIQAFENNQHWANLTPGNEGHDAPGLDYDPNGVYHGTWGRDDQFSTWEQFMTPGFVDEIHAELWFAEIRAIGATAANGMSLDQLDADLRAIGPEESRYIQSATP